MSRTALLFVSCLAVVSCSEPKPARTAEGTGDQLKSSKKDKGETKQLAAAPVAASASGCDASLWDRVYKSSRLEVVDSCKVVTGVIDELNVDDDGDEHMLLKLDPGQDALVNKRNVKKKNGDLVVEIVCANSTTKKSAVKACSGYSNRISLPPLHQHVRVTGSYVIDSHNGWAEIHPVSRIDAAK